MSGRLQWAIRRHSRRTEVADELYAPDYVDHVGRGSESGQVKGPEGIKQAVMLFRSAFPDLRFTLHEEMAEGATWYDPLLHARHARRTVPRPRRRSNGG
ncbi:MAG: ester cyclase [Methyloceanibacter sp.]